MNISSNLSFTEKTKLENLIKKHNLQSETAMIQYLGDSFEVWNVEDNELLKTITFQFARSHNVLLILLILVPPILVWTSFMR